MKSHILIGTLLVTLACSACESSPPRVDAALGRSLDHMIREQMYDPAASSRSSTPAPADGQRLEKVLQSHRGDVTHASEQVAKPVQGNTTGN